MYSIDEQRRSLREIRSLVARFVREEIDVPEFVPRLRKLFGPFDPPDLSVSEMTERESRELDAFVRIAGGWFGEDDFVIPRRSDWEYGRDMAPCAWIDGAAYRRMIVEILSHGGFALEL